MADNKAHFPATTYTTTQGDTWDAVAFKVCGRETLFGKILAANPDHMDVLVFPAGVALSIPELRERVAVSLEVPPWI